MQAAYYESNGSAREVLRVAEVETPQAGPGEVRVKLAASGVNPSDVKSRQGATRKIAWPRVIGLGSVRWNVSPWTSSSDRWAMWSIALATKSTGTRLS